MRAETPASRNGGCIHHHFDSTFKFKFGEPLLHVFLPGSPVAGGGLADVGYLAGGWHHDVALCGHVAAKPPFSWARAGVSCA